MSLVTANINSLWSSLIVEELIRQGVTYFCISPGSRSTPLTAAVAANAEARPFVHFDERGAAFHALGHAKATARPTALICTSGTAVANYLPAVVEASMSDVPMILLTADRPPELFDTGANQTITQTGIYSHYVRHETNLPCPGTDIKAEYVLTTVDQAVHRSRHAPAGPVQINCMFREPLAPIDTGDDFDDYLGDLALWRRSRAPFTSYGTPHVSASAHDLDNLAELIKRTLKGIMIVGRLNNRSEIEAVLRLSRQLNWPTLPDITSGLRLGLNDRQVVPYYDRLLASERFCARRRPAVCLHIGGPLISRRLEQFLLSDSPEHYILVNDNPRRRDPGHQVTMRLESDIPVFCDEMISRLDVRDGGDWLNGFHQGSAAIDGIINDVLLKEKGLSEPTIARQLSRMVPAGTGLFLASSLPIREMDVFAAGDGGRVDIAANRGASGIDGTIASAVGYGVGINKPVTVLIGDLALLHDLNSLAMVKKAPAPITIVVINNNGGNIFSFLPIAQHREIFEQFFITPHNLHFESAAKMFGLQYTRVESSGSFTDAYAAAAAAGKSSVIEIIVDRHHTSEAHRAVASAIRTRPGNW